MKTRIIMSGFILFFAAGFSLFVIMYQNHIWADETAKIKEHAQVIASAVWAFEKVSPKIYLTLAAEANGYRRVVVTDMDQSIYLDIKGPPLTGTDRFLYSAHLIPVYKLEAMVMYKGKNIAKISADWPCKTIYLYSYVLFCVFLLLTGIWLVLKLFEANRTLESRVQQRTAELEKENNERKRAEAELTEYTQRLSLHVQHTPLGVIEWDENFNVVAWNIAAEKIFGYRRDEALGRWGPELIVPDQERNAVMAVFNALLAGSGGTRATNKNRTQFGDIKTCDWYNTTLTDPSGKVIGVASLVQDITERMKIEETLRLTQFCFDHASIGIYRIGQDARIMDANDKGLHSLGYTRQELIQMTLTDINPTFNNDRWKKRKKKLRDGEPGSELLETRLHRKDGSTFDVEILINYIQFEDENFAVAFVRDISDRKTAELDKARLEAQLRQAQKMEAVGELAGGIAHDFNNLLQSISGYTQLLLMETQLDATNHGRLKEIEGASARAANLIRQLLTISRKIDSDLRAVNLNRIIDDMRNLLDRSIPKMISIRFALDTRIRPINADPIQIEQIIMNLSINAMHAMPDGGTLCIETSGTTLTESDRPPHLNIEAGDYTLLTVSDTGTGMDQQTLERIYEPFFSTKGIGKGTGLGLSMVYGIVQNHKAVIDCMSEPGQGTKFTT